LTAQSLTYALSVLNLPRVVIRVVH